MEMDMVWSNFHDQLKAFINRRIHRSQDADDILQNVYVKILSQLQSLRDEQRLHAWIYQIARNTIIDYYRSEKLLLELPEEFALDQVAELNFNDEIAKCIGAFISKLPEKYKHAIQLTELAGYSQKQLSEQLGISFSGAKSRVQRGRQKLKQLIVDCCHLELDRFGNVLDIKSSSQAAGNRYCECN